MNPKINVIYRSCDAVNAVNKSPRPFNLDKKTLIKICFKSLYNSLQGFNYQIIVLGDNLSEEMRDYFLSYKVELIEGVFGNDNSIKETVKIAKRFNDDEWIYFCEDDYLHTKVTFSKICNLINNKSLIVPGNFSIKKLLRKRHITFLSIKRFFSNPNLVILPYDYPDRYNLKDNQKSFVFHTENSHWRQVMNTTFTFLIQSKEVKKYQKTFIKASKRANDAYLSNSLFGKSFFFNKFLCVSPMPSLSTHMHVETMSPIVDWEKLVAQLLKEIQC